MKLQGLWVKGFQRILNAEIIINGYAINFLQGSNGAGKTSLLNAFRDMFAKGAIFKNRRNDASDETVTVCETDECIITQKVTAKDKIILDILLKENETILKGAKAREYLYEKVEILATNPRALLESKDLLGKITSMLLGDERLVEYKEKRKDIYESRATQNRIIADRKVKTRFMMKDVDVPDSAELSDKLAKLLEIQTKVKQIPQKLNDCEFNISEAKRKTVRDKDLIASLEQNLLDYEEIIKVEQEMQIKLEKAHMNHIDINDLVDEAKGSMATIGEAQETHAKFLAYNVAKEELEKAETLSKRLSDDLVGCDIEITEEILEMGLPAGFAIVEGELVDSNAKPVSNWMNSDRTAFCYNLIFNSIANKELKFLLIEDAHDLADDKIKLLSDWSLANECVVMAEVVREIPGAGNNIQVIEGKTV